MSALTRIREWLGGGARRRSAPAAVALAAAVVAALWLAGRGGAPAPPPREQFLAAGRAYEEGRTRDAARLYEEIVLRGQATMEVFYNLGNAEAKEGRLGAAVLNYRKAWRLAPRDPDVAANLRLALQATGASEADFSGAELLFTALSEREWAIAAAAAWWATGLLLSLALLLRSRRGLLLRLSALPAAFTLAALLGLWTWRGFERAPELVVLNERQNALRAPQAAASPHFSLPEGSLVREREHQGEWVRISYGQLSGWIPRAAAAPVLPQSPPE